MYLSFTVSPYLSMTFRPMYRKRFAVDSNRLGFLFVRNTNNNWEISIVSVVVWRNWIHCLIDWLIDWLIVRLFDGQTNWCLIDSSLITKSPKYVFYLFFFNYDSCSDDDSTTISFLKKSFAQSSPSSVKKSLKKLRFTTEKSRFRLHAIFWSSC